MIFKHKWSFSVSLFDTLSFVIMQFTVSQFFWKWVCICSMFLFWVIDKLIDAVSLVACILCICIYVKFPQPLQRTALLLQIDICFMSIFGLTLPQENVQNTRPILTLSLGRCVCKIVNDISKGQNMIKSRVRNDVFLSWKCCVCPT